MSKKSTIRGLSLWLFFLPLVFFGVLACDPCHDLAEKICECKETELEKRQCKHDLNLAKSQKFFEIAKEPKVCEEAHETCSCEALLRGQDEKCGMYREALKGD